MALPKRRGFSTIAPPMILRALEPEDLPALHALCVAPAVNRFLDVANDAPPEVLAIWLGTAPGTRAALGAFDGPSLVAAAGMVALDRPRLRHLGRAWIAAGPGAGAACRALLAALRDLARDWWALHRLELMLPVGWPHHLLLEPLGFHTELLRRRDLLQDGLLVDRLQAAWIREGLPRAPDAPPRAPPRRTAPAHVSLREVTPADAAAFARVLAEPSVVWGTLQSPFTPAAVWKSRLSTNDPARHRQFAATVDGEVVGSGGLHGALEPKRAHVWMLGMSIREAWQGRGVGQALMRTLLATAQELAIARLELEVYVDNARAIALYEKFGFATEGVKRLEAFREGAYVDARVMARFGEGT